MLVDDNSEMRELLRRLLADRATQFIECLDGEEACEAFAQHQPDWVLMDIQLKKMNGLVATAIISRRFPGAQVMIVTNHAGAKFHTAAKLAGARGLVSKENLLDLRDLISMS